MIRDIPCRYVFDTITAQNRHQYAFGADSNREYQILIDSVKVENFEYAVTDNGNNKSIRIGSYDKFIKGAQKYVIKYTVWGAINEFVDHSEFSWNVIGHEWKTDIHKASFSLTLPDNTKLINEDIKVFSGKYGTTDSSQLVSRNFTSSQIKGELQDTLHAGEGITLIVRLPEDYFNDRYRVKMHIADFYLERMVHILL
ncbi:MAG: DUF2207 domain-containing protein [Chloroflexia bacterium]|nr:DUF2207 domain-containing protein [Chloroflexia bacterium]